MKQCKNGHVLTPELVYRRPNGAEECRACKRDSACAAREKNREKIREQDRARYKANRERILPTKRRYYHEHVEDRKNYASGYRDENRERIRARDRAAYQENSPSEKERTRQYRLSHPDKVAEYKATHKEEIRESNKRSRAKKPDLYRELTRRRRAIQRGRHCCFEPWMARYLRFRQNGKCHYCGQPMLAKSPLTREAVEHLTPLSRGGWHCWENVVLSCGSCNSKKSTKTEEEFLGGVPILLAGVALRDYEG